MSEKMDGIRAYWDRTKLLSRRGKDISVPQWFLEDFPSIPLDGELWMGRGKYEQLIGIIKSTQRSWSEVKYVIFDLPSSKLPFESRWDQLKDLPLPSHVQLAEIWQCKDMQQLKQLLDSVCNLGGEGLVATKPQSHYTPGNNFNVFKVTV